MSFVTTGNLYIFWEIFTKLSFFTYLLFFLPENIYRNSRNFYPFTFLPGNFLFSSTHFLFYMKTLRNLSFTFYRFFTRKFTGFLPIGNMNLAALFSIHTRLRVAGLQSNNFYIPNMSRNQCSHLAPNSGQPTYAYPCRLNKAFCCLTNFLCTALLSWTVVYNVTVR